MQDYAYDRKYDVVIAGGGVSGAVAAIAAGRTKAKTLVIEQTGYLGGSLTTCGVGPMMTFHAGEKQVIKGIMQEIVDQMIIRNYSPGHIKDTTQYISYLTPFNSEGLKIVLDDMLQTAGCHVLFHTFIGKVNTAGNEITSLTVCNKDGLHDISGKVFVDATGDGDVATWAGAHMIKGRQSDGAMQPMTMNMKYCNVNGDILRKHITDNASEFPRMKNNIELMNRTSRLSFAGFTKEFKSAQERGELDIKREEVLCFETNTQSEFIINTTRILDHDGTNAVSISDAERIGRKQCEKLDIFLRKYIPGFSNAVLEFTGPSIGIRGSRQLIGKYTLNEQDIMERKEFDTVIAHSAYPIDIHNLKGEGTASSFVSKPGTYYSIPYEVMVCNEVSNLLVTGRCVSATFEAQAAIRTTPTVGALGHACGIAAAMAAHNDIETKNVDVKELQGQLKIQNAYIIIAIIMIVVSTKFSGKTRKAWAMPAGDLSSEKNVRHIALISPIIPVLLVFIWHLPLVPAIIIGIIATLVLATPRNAVQVVSSSFVEGIQDTAGAAALMIGIGMVLKAVMAPEVAAVLEPLIKTIIPTSPLTFILIFGLLSPLAIYRGPLNVWGLGSGIVALLAVSGMNPIAAMVALRLDSNVQAVCDPTNSHNVWVADFTKTDVNEFTKKTIVWIMASTFVGLIVASFIVSL